MGRIAIAFKIACSTLGEIFGFILPGWNKPVTLSYNAQWLQGDLTGQDEIEGRTQRVNV
jgi:hypothetical protein